MNSYSGSSRDQRSKTTHRGVSNHHYRYGEGKRSKKASSSKKHSYGLAGNSSNNKNNIGNYSIDNIDNSFLCDSGSYYCENSYKSIYSRNKSNCSTCSRLIGPIVMIGVALAIGFLMGYDQAITSMSIKSSLRSATTTSTSETTTSSLLSSYWTSSSSNNEKKSLSSSTTNNKEQTKSITELLGIIRKETYLLEEKLKVDYGMSYSRLFTDPFLLKKLVNISRQANDKYLRKIMKKIVLSRIGTTSSSKKTRNPKNNIDLQSHDDYHYDNGYFDEKEEATTLTWVTMGDISASGHGNTKEEVYTSILEETVKDIYEAIGIQFTTINLARDSLLQQQQKQSGPEASLCIDTIINDHHNLHLHNHDDARHYGYNNIKPDIISWDYSSTAKAGMTEIDDYRIALWSTRVRASYERHHDKPLLFIFDDFSSMGKDTKAQKHISKLQQQGVINPGNVALFDTNVYENDILQSNVLIPDSCSTNSISSVERPLSPGIPPEQQQEAIVINDVEEQKQHRQRRKLKEEEEQQQTLPDDEAQKQSKQKEIEEVKVEELPLQEELQKQPEEKEVEEVQVEDLPLPEEVQKKSEQKEIEEVKVEELPPLEELQEQHPPEKEEQQKHPSKATKNTLPPEPYPRFPPEEANPKDGSFQIAEPPLDQEQQVEAEEPIQVQQQLQVQQQGPLPPAIKDLKCNQSIEGTMRCNNPYFHFKCPVSLLEENRNDFNNLEEYLRKKFTTRTTKMTKTTKTTSSACPSDYLKYHHLSYLNGWKDHKLRGTLLGMFFINLLQESILILDKLYQTEKTKINNNNDDKINKKGNSKSSKADNNVAIGNNIINRRSNKKQNKQEEEQIWKNILEQFHQQEKLEQFLFDNTNTNNNNNDQHSISSVDTTTTSSVKDVIFSNTKYADSLVVTELDPINTIYKKPIECMFASSSLSSKFIIEGNKDDNIDAKKKKNTVALVVKNNKDTITGSNKKEAKCDNNKNDNNFIYDSSNSRDYYLVENGDDWLTLNVPITNNKKHNNNKGYYIAVCFTTCTSNKKSVKNDKKKGTSGKQDEQEEDEQTTCTISPNDDKSTTILDGLDGIKLEHGNIEIKVNEINVIGTTNIESCYFLAHGNNNNQDSNIESNTASSSSSHNEQEEQERKQLRRKLRNEEKEEEMKAISTTTTTTTDVDDGAASDTTTTSTPLEIIVEEGQQEEVTVQVNDKNGNNNNHNSNAVIIDDINSQFFSGILSKNNFIWGRRKKQQHNHHLGTTRKKIMNKNNGEKEEETSDSDASYYTLEFRVNEENSSMRIFSIITI